MTKNTGVGAGVAPDGWHTITPRIVADDASGLVEFLKRVFGATGTYHPDRPAEMTIGDSIIMVTDTGIRQAMPAFLYVYVQDTDETYREAMSAGAESLEAPSDQAYGDRRAMVRDRWGNTWQVATRRGRADS
jgi:uncharacterized glyoxalase superfamily protein PhnB